MLDDCDYYVLILAGRYGSEDSDGLGFTEKEYDYAISQGIPVMSFVVRNIGALALSKCESNGRLRKKLDAFRKKVYNGKMVQFYDNSNDLKGHVSSSINKCIRDFPARGWGRGANSTVVSSITTSPSSGLIIYNPDVREEEGTQLTEKTFIQFIESINYREWKSAIENADNLYSDEHFGGIFSIYNKMIKVAKNADESKDFAESI